MARVEFLALLLLSPAVFTAAGPESAKTAEYSEPAPLASRSLLLDGARAGERSVVVGDRGHILLSDDKGRTWRQARVPTQAMLTGVHFADARHGWVVGHDEVILRTEDGGETWTRVHYAPEKQQPLLDVWFKDVNYGLAVGAYATMLVTRDGGETWTQQTFNPQESSGEKKNDINADPAEEEASAGDSHLNKLVPSPDGKLYMAAEAGHLFRSDDDGATWTALPSPYEGSFFGLLPLDANTLLAFGLRGHLFRSQDAGRSWIAIPTDTVAMLTDALHLEDGTLVITGLSGTILVSRDNGRSFKLHQQPDRKGIQAALPAGPGRLVTIGEGGVQNIRIDAGAA